MSLKDLTLDKHAEAESTKFMKAVFAKTLPFDLWVDWTLQKSLFYGTIEDFAGANGLLDDLPDLRRESYLTLDYNAMNSDSAQHAYRPVVIEYNDYLVSISNDPNKIMAHLYTWHMGDMFGGQMIKKIVPGSHRNLEFADTRTLMTNIRAKLDDSMGDEANVAFDWAIRMMRDYDSSLG
jgi:heme oxygenase